MSSHLVLKTKDSKQSSLFPSLGVRVHFVGVGGIGMCGLAELLHTSGSVVTGSDLVENPQVKRLKQLGIPVFKGHKKSHIGRAETVVQSSAVLEKNIEIQTARSKKIPVLKRSEALAEVMRLKRGLVVAGTHGKTTTTHLLSLMFIHNKKDPTVVIGGRSHLFKSTAFLGKGEWFIAESDESDGGFKHLSPEIALITNIDNDHVDYYGSFKKLKQAFLNFALKTPFYGTVVACGDDPVLRKMLTSLNRKVIFYGFNANNHFVLKKTGALKYQVLGISVTGEQKSYQHKNLGILNMPIYGSMNSLNALGAIASAMIAGISFEKCVQSLQKFKGLDRRFQKKGSAKGIEFYDDYAHHPTEIKAVLSAFREKWGPKKRLIVLFQPHRFSRTQACWQEFLTCFKEANLVFLMDIYLAGEKPLKGISSAKLAKEIKTPLAFYIPNKKTTKDPLKVISKKKGKVLSLPAFLKKGDVLITMGAGSVYKEGERLLSLFKNQK